MTSDDMRITVGELLRAKPCSNCCRRTRDVAGQPPLCRLCRELIACRWLPDVSPPARPGGDIPPSTNPGDRTT